jgi:hypothetical protein
MSSAQMHNVAHMQTPVAEMTVIELDDVRHLLRLSKKQVCQLAGIHEATYQRWLKWARGEPDGCRPQPRTIRALREALSAEFEQRGDGRVNIAAILQPSNAGDLGSENNLRRNEQRDSRRDGIAGNAGQEAMSLSGTPDRAA